MSGEKAPSVENLRQKLQNRGKIVVATVDTSENVKKTAQGLAMDAIEDWDAEQARKKDAELQKQAEAKGMSLEDYKKQHAIGKFLTAIPSGVVSSVRRSVQLDKYYKTAKKAIEKTGSLSAGTMAIEEFGKVDNQGKKKGEIVEIVKDRVESGEDIFDVDVAERVVAAKEAGDENEDTDVEVMDADDERIKAIKDAYLKYAETIADTYGDYHISKKSRSRKARKKMSASERADEIEQLRIKDRETAQKALYEALEKEEVKADGVSANNYKKVQEKIDDAVAFLHEELSGGKKGEKHKNAVEALKKYLDDNISVVEGKAKTGLAAKEAYTQLKDRAILKHGVIIGSAVSIGASLATGVAKSKSIQAITNSSLAAHWMKMGVAGLIGGVNAARNKKNAQARENVKQAIGRDEGPQGKNEEEKEKAKKSRFELVSVADEIENMRGMIGPDGKLVGDYNKAARLIAELKVRNELQNKNEIQLLQFNSREDIEKQKCEMFKAMSALKKAMANVKDMPAGYTDGVDFAKGDPKLAIEAAMKELRNDHYERIDGRYMKVRGIEDDVEDAKKHQRKDRIVAGVKGAIVAAGVAGVMDFVFNHTQILNEVRALKNGELKFKGLNLVEATGAVTVGGEEVAKAESESLADVEKREALKTTEGKPVIIEEDRDGGVSVGIDKNGNGKLDAGEYLRGEGREAGIDLTKESDYQALSKELEENYNVELQREAIESTKYGQVEIGTYLENAENARDVSGGVDWSRSATKVAFSNPMAVAGDGMDSYEVSVWGVNGNAIPDGAKFFVDFDGDGPGKALEFAIKDGKAIIPADVVNTDALGAGGAAQFIGTARVGELDGSKIISYATAVGPKASMTDKISAAVSENAYAFTAVDLNTGEKLSQFAVNGDNTIISNMSEIFNGIQVQESDRLPSVFRVNDIGDGQEKLVLASGEVIEDMDVEGGYHPEFDAFENTPFKGSDTYLGTPMTWDADGDGILSATEESSYVKQLLVRTGTNPYMLGQNASNYGLLEPDRLKDIIPSEKLAEWGISDGIVDSEEELNILMSALKESGNAAYWDKLANATINEMETQLMGGGFEVGEVAERVSTYANSQRMFDTSNSSTVRTVLYPYQDHLDKDGNLIEREYVGNKGWWCRKYGAEGGKVGDMPLCEQKSIERVPVKQTDEKQTGEKQTSEKQTDEKQTGEKQTGEKQTDEKQTGEKQTGEKQTDEKQTGEKQTGEKQTDEKQTGEKQTGEKQTGEKQTGEKQTDELTGKGPDANAGPGAQIMDETELRPETKYVEATPDNHVNPEVVAGSEVSGGDSSIYENDAVLDNTGEVMTDTNGNMYITNPGGTESAEEIAKNIADNTQTTYTPDTTDWVPNAPSDIPVNNAAEVMADNAAPNISTSGGGGGVTNYSQDDLADIFKSMQQ